MEKQRAFELLSLHTNKIITNQSLVAEIKQSAPSSLTYVNIKHMLYHIAHGLNHVPQCANPDCNNHVKWDKHNQQYTKYCSYKCANYLTSKTTSQKRMQTNKEKYGGNAPACSKKVVLKAKQTNILRYGEQYTQVFNERSKQSLLKKYGIINVSQLHIDQQTRDLLNDKNFLYEQHVKKQQSLQKIARDLNVSDTTVNRCLKKHNIHPERFYSSDGEIQIKQFLAEHNISFLSNVKNIISPFELDIYIPEYKLAIEYNGLFWHSEANGKTSSYHLQKTIECEKKGIRLIHIFEDEWRDQQQKCKDTLLHFLGKSEKGVFARLTTIKEITWKEAKKFLDAYHLLGAGSPGNYRIGAYDPNNNLIAVMVFGLPNNEKSKNIIELKRFVTNKKNNPGLGSKMFFEAIKQKQYQEVIAFVDRRWFTGSVKNHIGFIKVGETKPAIWWTDGKNRFHRRFMTKQQLIKQGNPQQLSKRNILLKYGFYRIWDCGKIKLLWTKNK